MCLGPGHWVMRSAETPQYSVCRQKEKSCRFSPHVDQKKCVADCHKARPSTNRIWPNILVTFGRKKGGWGGGGENYTRTSLTIWIMYKLNGVRIQVNDNFCFKLPPLSGNPFFFNSGKSESNSASFIPKMKTWETILCSTSKQ